MSTIVCADLRRTDQRNTVEPIPHWIASGVFSYHDDDKGALLFSFPAEDVNARRIIIHGAVVEIIEGFVGGTPTVDIGLGTIATNAVTTGGNITIVDEDEYIPAADITEATPGFYPADSGDSVTLWAAGKMVVLTPADTTVPVIYASVASNAALTAGSGRLHLLLSRIQ